MDGHYATRSHNQVRLVEGVNGRSPRIIAACFAMASFAVAILAGLASENPSSSVLFRAMIAMFVCYPVGMMVGMVCDRVIMAHVEAHRNANPAPDSAGA